MVTLHSILLICPLCLSRAVLAKKSHNPAFCALALTILSEKSFYDEFGSEESNILCEASAVAHGSDYQWQFNVFSKAQHVRQGTLSVYSYFKLFYAIFSALQFIAQSVV